MNGPDPDRAPSPTIIWPARLAHGICHYHRQWIPGDERGFRSRRHRIHSSGDYKSPPPAEEHAGLRRCVSSTVTGAPVRLDFEQSVAVGTAFIVKLSRMQSNVLILACGPTHLHVLFTPTEDDVRRQLGKAKQYASLKCPNRSGQLWGELCDIEMVTDDAGASRTFSYIDDHRHQGAWVWRCDRQE